jgi:protease-4
MQLENYLLSGAWAIEPRAAQSFLPKVLQLLRGEKLSFAEKREKVKADCELPEDDDCGYETETAPKEDMYSEDQFFAIIDIDGAIIKEDGFCSVGTETIGEHIKHALADTSIRGIMLIIDSPGGMVDGTETLVNTIAAASSIKPIIGFVDGMACSAAYWIASGCDEIIAYEKNSMVGSIGVMVSFADYSEYFKMNGINPIEVYATQSSEKNKDYNEALKGNFKPLQEGTLNIIADNFIGSIKSFRPKTDEQVFKGATFLAEKALELGLIDSIGDYSYALGRLNKLASKNKSSISISTNYTNSKKMNFITSGFSLVRKVLGFNAIAQSQDGSAIIATSDLANIEAELSAKDDKIKDLGETVKAKNQELEQASAALKTASAEMETLKASLKIATEERDSLSAKFHAQTTPVQTGEDAATKGENVLVDGFVNLKAEHNQEFLRKKGGLK